MSNIPTTIGGKPIYSATEMPLDTKGLCIMIVGPPGAGKSCLAAYTAQNPKAAPLLFLDAEGGTEPIRGISGVSCRAISTWEDARATATDLLDDTYFQTIVWDNLSEMAELNMNLIVRTGKTPHKLPDLGDWYEQKIDIKNFIRFNRDMAASTGKNIIFCVWDSKDRSESGAAVGKTLALANKLGHELPGTVDIVGYLSVLSDKLHTRVLQLNEDPRLPSKFRRSAFDASAMSIPDVILYRYPEVSPLGDMIACMRGGDKWPIEKYAKYAAVLAKEKENDKKEKDGTNDK